MRPWGDLDKVSRLPCQGSDAGTEWRFGRRYAHARCGERKTQDQATAQHRQWRRRHDGIRCRQGVSRTPRHLRSSFHSRPAALPGGSADCFSSLSPSMTHDWRLPAREGFIEAFIASRDSCGARGKIEQTDTGCPLLRSMLLATGGACRPGSLRGEQYCQDQCSRPVCNGSISVQAAAAQQAAVACDMTACSGLCIAPRPQ